MLIASNVLQNRAYKYFIQSISPLNFDSFFYIVTLLEYMFQIIKVFSFKHYEFWYTLYILDA